MNGTNAATLEEVRRDIIGTTFTGRIVLDCLDGRIEKVEVHAKWVPPWKRQQGAAVDGKPDAV